MKTAAVSRAAVAGRATRRPAAWIRSRLQVPLYRNGYALIASSALTSALGLLFWLLAARTYSTAAVGVSAALISAMTLLANISQLNLKGALNRFLPRAGARSGALVARCYLLALGVTAASSAIFLAGLGIWAPKLGFLTDRPELALWFVAATMAWTIFVLQDSVLAGIRQAAWVPAENLVFSLAKIALLVGLVAATPTLGAFVSWSAPVLLLVLPVNLLLFRRLIPAHVRATRGREQWFSARRVARYVAADYFAYAVWSGTIGALPLVVLGVAGADANAYFFVSWAIAYSLYLISSGMGMSLLAEASLDPERLAEHTRRMVLETARIVVPAAAVVVAAAPALLGLLGDEYSAEAVTLLRLLALSAVPYVIVAAYVNVARVEGRMRAVVATYCVLCGLVLAVGVPLLGTSGVEGLGVAWLGAQSIVAAGLIAINRGRRSARRAVGPLAGVRRAVLGLRRRGAATRGLKPVLAVLNRELGERGEWKVHNRPCAVNDVAISTVGPAGRRPVAVVKHACSDAAATALARQERLLLALAGEPRLRGWRRLVPRALVGGRVRGRVVLAETWMPGTPAEDLLGKGLTPEQLLGAAVSAIRPLHEATSRRAVIEEPLLRSWVDEPLARLRPAAARRSRLSRWAEAIECLREELREALADREVTTSWVHGDLCPGNLLMGPDGRVEGIVDWEQARTQGVGKLDLLHLLVTTRMATEGQELGTVVADLLDRPLGRPDPGSTAIPTRTLLLLTWLHHVEGNLAKSNRYGRSRRWVRRNVDPVLGAVLRARASDESAGPAVRSWPAAVAIGGLGAGLAAWAGSLGAIDPRAMSDLGLVSVLPPAFLVGLAALTASFAFLAYRRPDSPRLLAAHLVALVAVLHATPAIVYGTLRYSWAWKHVGIVDYIDRHGSVATDIDKLPVYHNWPGFFGLDALLTQLAALPDAIEVATWAPLFFNLLNLAGLVFLFSGLTRDRRIVWLAAWLFFIASWVGQDYFAPQAFAFFLYLVLMGVVVRWAGPGSFKAWSVPVAVLLLVAIAISHPLTSVMAAVSLAALALFRLSVARLALIAAAVTVAWDATFAWDFVEPNVRSTLESVNLPWATTQASLASGGDLSPGQALVSTLSRGLVVAIVVLALVGVARQLRAGGLNRTAALLALAPLALFASGDYEGEILFRIYLFSLPFVAFLAAHAFTGGARTAKPALAFAATGALLLGAFLFAYYGKERQYYFTPGEVAAAEYVLTHARPGALVIEGSRDYPGQFKNYEQFDYVPLSREPRASHSRFVSQPEAVFSEWMSDPSRNGAYLIITRSQKAEVDELGVLPRGSLDAIERRLLASPRFRPVFRNRDATVFTLSPATRAER